MVTRAPVGVAVMRHVTRMPLVTPRMWRNWRRNVPGSLASDHCSARQVTGTGNGPNQRRATIRATIWPSFAGLSTTTLPVVGQHAGQRDTSRARSKTRSGGARIAIPMLERIERARRLWSP